MSDKDETEVIPPDMRGIVRALSILKAGGLVAVPTETVYGLAARADRAEAVAKIFAAKGRPASNPLIVHVRDLAAAERYGNFTRLADARMLAEKYWPGPLTLVVPVREDAPLAKAISAGLRTVALRVPSHPVLQNLLKNAPFALAAPSANRSGFISPTTPGHVLATLSGKIDAVIDAGPCTAGVESTIATVRDSGRWAELRPGPVDLGEAYAAAYPDADKGPGLEAATGAAIEAPGQFDSHYSPGKPMRLDAPSPEADEFFIGHGPIDCDCNLSPDLSQSNMAARLYSCLHQAHASAKPRIAVAPIPAQGIGAAINDRLRRAAAPLGKR